MAAHHVIAKVMLNTTAEFFTALVGLLPSPSIRAF
jgi:hypothetical protein